MIAAIILGAALTLAICLGADRLGRLLGVIDQPDGERKRHARPTPQVGGFSVGAPLALCAAWQAIATEFRPLYGTIAAVALALLVLGAVDDRQHIRPLFRLVLSTAICLIAVLLVPGLQVTFLKFTAFGSALYLDGVWVLAFTLFCLVGLQNAVNMADGKNGLVLALMLIWTGLLALDAPAHLQPLLLVLLLALAVTLAFNLAGRLFLGDSGTYMLGVVVGLIAIYCYQVTVPQISADTVMLWFLVPVLDCLRLIVSRLRNGRSPFSSDLDHLHHRVGELMPWRWGLLFYAAMVAVPALAARIVPQATSLLAVLATFAYVMVIVLTGRPAADRRIVSTL